MTRADLQKLLAAAVRKGAITQADATRILAAFDNGTLDPDLPREIKAALDDEGLAGKAALLAAVILLARAKAPAGKVWTYSPSTRRYTAPGRVADTTITGGVVTPEEVRQIVDAVIDASEADVLASAARLTNQRFSLAAWYAEMEEGIATRNVAMAAAARGGIDQLTEADRLFIRDQIIAQFDALSGFGDDIARGRYGKPPAGGAYEQRVLQYVRQQRAAYENMRGHVAIERGFDLEQWFLGQADHCRTGDRLGCVERAAMRKVPINSVAGQGACTCLHNCKCVRRLYRASDQQRAVPATAA